MSAVAARSLDVLLVEDDPGTARLLEEAFGEVADVTLHVVDDGFGALDFVRNRGDHATAPTPRLVMLDLGLPGKDGKAVLEEVKTDPELRHIPVVVFTDSTDRGDVDDAYALGANAYVTKPLGYDGFTAVAREVHDFWLSTATTPA